MKKKENEGGRPTKYRPDFARQAKRLALLGLTDKEIAEVLGVTASTLYEWKRTYPKFSEALKGGKIEADAKVAASLYKRAIGYRFTETTEESTAGIVTKEKKVLKEVPPDVGAQTLWLKNRRPDRWRERIELDPDKLTDEQLDRLIERMRAKK